MLDSNRPYSTQCGPWYAAWNDCPYGSRPHACATGEHTTEESETEQQ